MRIQLSDHFSYGKLIRFTAPSVVMMIFTSIYSVVDGFFVSNFAGKTAFAAVNLIMPVLLIIGTFGFMLGTGGTALVAITYGMGDKEKANSIFSLLTYVAFVLGIAFSIIGFISVRPIAIKLGADGELLTNCVRYGRIILVTMPFMILQVMFQSFFVAAEKPRLGFVVTVISGVMNMILDAILCTCLPLEFKLVGAAVATATSQAVGGIIPFIYFKRENSSILRLGKTTFDGKIIFKACSNGCSEFMTNISMSIVGILFNTQLLKYAGADGIAAYGVMMYASMIFTAMFVGFTMGSAPIVSFHYGAQNDMELKGVLKKSLILCGAFGECMMILAEMFAYPVCRIFVGYDVSLCEFTVSGFRIFSISFIFIGFGIYASGFFTALGDGITSAIISFVRSLILESAAVLILPIIFGVDGIWYSVVIAETLAFIMSIILLVKKRKRYHYLTE